MALSSSSHGWSNQLSSSGWTHSHQRPSRALDHWNHRVSYCRFRERGCLSHSKSNEIGQLINYNHVYLFLCFTLASIVVSLLLSIYHRNSSHHAVTTLEIKAMCGKYVHGHMERKIQRIQETIE